MFKIDELCHSQTSSLSGTGNIMSVACHLRTHVTLVPKMTVNVTFMQFLCFHLITSRDRPCKVHISLKLRSFYTHFKKENPQNGTCHLDKYNGSETEGIGGP